jgi:hypothetical protein
MLWQPPKDNANREFRRRDQNNQSECNVFEFVHIPTSPIGQPNWIQDQAGMKLTSKAAPTGKPQNMGGFCYPATDLTGCHNLRSRSTHAHLVDCGEGRYDKRGAEGQDQCSEDQSRAHSGLPANISPPETHFHPSGRFNSMRQ